MWQLLYSQLGIILLKNVLGDIDKGSYSIDEWFPFQFFHCLPPTFNPCSFKLDCISGFLPGFS